METIGVRELKANLSARLKRVEAGARFTVTDRGRAIATLAPVDAPKDIQWVTRMVAERGARWGGARLMPLRSRVKSKGMQSSLMVIEDRG